MASGLSDSGFIVWGVDQTPYGPVDYSTLVSWVQSERVTPDTWIFAARDGCWQRAADLWQLKNVFDGRPNRTSQPLTDSLGGVHLEALRRIKLLAGLTDEQLERFADFIELEKMPPETLVVREGQRECGLYLILDGQLTQATNIAGKRQSYGSLQTGDFFGDGSLLEQSPCPVEVTTSSACVIVKLSAEAFHRLLNQAPELAAPLLLALGQTLTARLRGTASVDGARVNRRATS